MEKTCGVCGRLLHEEPEEYDDPALDCGGDCWGCVKEAEESIESDDDRK